MARGTTAQHRYPRPDGRFRDPGGRLYAGVIRALGKAGVLPADFAERLTAIAGFRNVLTELYVEVDPVKVYEHLQRTPDDIRFFARCIIEYLERKGHLAPP